MKRTLGAATLGALMLTMSTGFTQSKTTRTPTATTRYFQLTLNLKFGANGEQQATTQTITTEVAAGGNAHGSCRARMVSQTPTGSGTGTKYIEVGTKFDADDIHLEGSDLALHFLLSASRPVRMILYKNKDGAEIEEPIITDRAVELTVKLPLDQKKVVFDSSSKSLMALKPLGNNPEFDPAAETAAGGLPKLDQPMVIEMMVSELK